MTNEEKYFEQLRTAKKGTILKCRDCEGVMEFVHPEVGWIHDDERTCNPTMEEEE